MSSPPASRSHSLPQPVGYLVSTPDASFNGIFGEEPSTLTILGEVLRDVWLYPCCRLREGLGGRFSREEESLDRLLDQALDEFDGIETLPSQTCTARVRRKMAAWFNCLNRVHERSE